MAKLTKADVARHLKISRETLYQWVRKGRISVDPDGFILRECVHSERGWGEAMLLT